MAQNAKPADPKPQDPTVQKKSSKKLLIGIVASFLIAIAAGASWYFTKGKSDTPNVEEVRIAPPKTPIFVALEPFTVNLLRETSDQYLQLGLSMKMFEAEVEKNIKANLPEIRSRILQLLTTKTATELLSAEGKTKLVKEIMTLSNGIIGISNLPEPAPAAPAATDSASQQVAAPAATPDPVPVPAPKLAEPKGIVDVLFTSFIIQ